MKLSVALCTYNGAQYIQEQLNSILNQSVSVDEIVICDDSSRDETLEIAKRVLQDSGVNYQIFVNDPPLGVANNFLKALKQTTGDYVFTCDQDDVWHTDKVKIFLEALDATQKDMYFSNGVLVDGTGAPLGVTLWAAYGIESALSTKLPIINILLKRPLVTGAAMMVSRRLIDSVSEIPAGLLHDEWLSVVAALKEAVVPIYRTTFNYRQHGHNVVGAKKYGLTEKMAIWWKNLLALQELREKALARASAMAAAAQRSQDKALTQEAHTFWLTLNSFSRLSSWKQIFIATRLLCAGQYSRYYTGIRGYVRDLLWAIAVRR